VAGGYNPNFLTTVVNSLTSAISAGSAAATLVKENATNITTQLSGTTGFINAVQPNGSNPPGTAPQAWLTIIFFDERFNFIPAADGGVAQQQVAATVGSGGSSLTLVNIKAPKNGYAYVYISNQSNNDVYFDDFVVQVNAGNIIEENHYYAYGLKIAGISSRKLADSYEGETKNNYLYQGAFAELDEDIGWTDFPLRSYDAQIGRFVQADPFGQFPSQYTGMGNDPVNLIDPSGGIGIPCPGTSQLAIFFMKAGETIGKGLNALSRLSPWLSIGVNAANLGTGIYNRSVQFKIIDRQLTGNLTQQAGEVQQGASPLGLGSPGGDGGDDDWQDLPKSVLEDYYRKRNPLQTEGQLQNTIGSRFEEAWNLAARRLLAGDQYVPNRDPQTGGTRTTVPDGIANGYVKTIWGRRITVPRASWFEVKAKSGDIYNSTSTGQTLGHITNLAASVPYKYRYYGPWKASAASLTFITTSDVSIAPSVIAEATLSNIIIYQYKAQYKMGPGGYMSVRFQLRSRNGIGFTGLTTTPVVLR
jgi:RHS repeat-associated protein